jgi:hypothetical protein
MGNMDVTKAGLTAPATNLATSAISNMISGSVQGGGVPGLTQPGGGGVPGRVAGGGVPGLTLSTTGGGVPGVRAPFSIASLSADVASNPLGNLSGINLSIPAAAATPTGIDPLGTGAPSIYDPNKQYHGDIDAMMADANKLLQSDNLHDQLMGQELMSKAMNMFEAISKLIQQQADMQKTAIQNIR